MLRAWFAGVHFWVSALAVVAVAVGWIWIWHQSVDAKAKSPASTIYTLAGATFVLAPPLGWPLTELHPLCLIGR